MLWAIHILLVLIVILAGCSHVANDLANRQEAIQNCILIGGTPQAGPDNTIICQR